GGQCDTTNRGDPIVLYDQLAGRWLLSQFAFSRDGNGNKLPSFYQCIAISKTDDPTGDYWLYAFEMSQTLFNDYAKFGVWPDGYYMGINQFGSPTYDSFRNAGVVAFDRARMLQGLPATYQKFALTNSYFNVMPSDLDGSASPPAGSPNYFLSVSRS